MYLSPWVSVYVYSKERTEAKVASDTFNQWVAATMNYRNKGGWPANATQLLGVYMNDVTAPKTLMGNALIKYLSLPEI